MSSNICDFEDDPSSRCSEDLKKEVDVKTTCEKIKNEYDVLVEQAKIAGEVLTSFTLPGFLKSLGASNKVSSKMKSVIENFQRQIQIVDTTQTCENAVNLIQSNKITLSDKCRDYQIEMAKLLKDSPYLGQFLVSTEFKNLRQKNESEVRQQCVLQTYIATALKMDASIESAALVKFLQKSSDLMASNEADTEICNNIRSEMNSCQYVKTNLCCNNKFNLTQQNLVECPANNISQENSKTALQICNLAGTTTVDAGLTTKLKSSLSLSVSQTATGTSMMWFVIFIALFILGPPLGVGLFSLFLPKEIVVAFFGIICIVIGIVLWNIYKPLPSPPEFINKTRDKPIFAAKDYRPNSSYKPTAQTEIKSIKYGAAKKICLDDKNCRAMDFSITKIKDNEEITDDNVGIPVFYNSIKDEYCEEDIEDKKNTYFTSYKYPTPTPYDIYGKILIGVGAVLILMAMYLLFKSSKSKTNTRI